ncbi:MAG: hypothetical protein HOY71_11335 [Nonomuraea sp.]|nr:hypothetical protein [Nonomuraea sp.]
MHYGQDEVEVAWDPARALPVSDPTGRDLRLGLGAFVETCLIVCASAGFSIGFRPDPGPRRVGFLHRTAEPYETAFTVEDVRQRGSNRGAYEPGRLPEELVERLGVHRVGCADVADLLYVADLHQFGDDAVSGELREWLRLSPRHPRYLQDGLTDRALALSRAKAIGLAVALSWRPLRKLAAVGGKGLLDYDGDVFVLAGSVEDQVEHGRALMRLWLTLAGLGYTTHPLSQVIDCADTRRILAVRLGVDDPETLLHIARVGRPKAPAAPSARLRT